MEATNIKLFQYLRAILEGWTYSESPFGFRVGFAIDESLCAAKVVESDGTPGPFTKDGGGVDRREALRLHQPLSSINCHLAAIASSFVSKFPIK